LSKHEELSKKLDEITPENLEELIDNSIAEALTLREMRTEIRFLFEWRTKMERHAPTKLERVTSTGKSIFGCCLAEVGARQIVPNRRVPREW
jgi:hypothetical protein